MDGAEPESAAKLPWPRRSNPVRFFHGFLFITGGGLALFWSRWGLVLIAVSVIVGVVLLKAKASTLDMGQERLKLDHLRDDLTFILHTAEHPTGSVEEQLHMLEVLHSLGGISRDDYATRRAQLTARLPVDKQDETGIG